MTLNIIDRKIIFTVSNYKYYEFIREFYYNSKFPSACSSITFLGIMKFSRPLIKMDT